MAAESCVPDVGAIQTLVETFNAAATNSELLLDSVGKINAMVSSSNGHFSFVCKQINTELLFTLVLEKSRETTTRKTERSVALISESLSLLSKIFDSLTPIEVIKLYGPKITSSISVNCEEFQLISVQQILRLSEETIYFSEFMSNPDLIMIAIDYLGGEYLTVAGISRKILNNLFNYTANVGWLFSDNIFKKFRDILLMKGSVVQFRVYEVFLDFIVKYPEHIETCENCGIFNDLLSGISQGDDILWQLNALEMVSQIASSGSQGLEYVEKNGIMEWMESVTTSDDPLASFLLPGIIKFFGVIAQANPAEIIPRYKKSVIAIFENLSNEDPTLRCLCAETIAFISSKSEGIKLLYANPDPMKKATEIMGKIISNPGEGEHVRRRTVDSLADMFNHDTFDIEASMICEKLFRHIDPDPVAFLLNLVKQPFMELRYSCLKLFCGVSKYTWAEQDMVLCPGFMEYLLDRNTETEKRGRELKFEITNNLSISATSKENFGIEYHEKILKYAKQGPFYSESEVVVSYEREN